MSGQENKGKREVEREKRERVGRDDVGRKEKDWRTWADSMDTPSASSPSSIRLRNDDLRQAFDVIDTDGDLPMLCAISSAKFDEIKMLVIDLNGDGFIELDECERVVMKPREEGGEGFMNRDDEV
ncbi:hypothetical protein QJS10_CPA02g00453 [Acorus calamus]|uniref:EF-hand domain-containing protein n=1 Tax=Acorus calamus TaxID=4465 RepID=A0AAV9FCG7_ACOCL|nr:hypothetical protein QJS10_CPA02g00453 [Acorus calamus]